MTGPEKTKGLVNWIQESNGFWSKEYVREGIEAGLRGGWLNEEDLGELKTYVEGKKEL